MVTSPKSLRTCPNGHAYYKSSDCPTCPTCEQEKTAGGFLVRLSAPARRALEHHGITTLQQLSQHSEKEILKLHGIGPGSLPKLREALEEQGLTFKP
ncbi:RNA polymerase alpha subunit C-terminal domain-containing protein [Paenibacillus soyae]|uniref:RNA polymerase alpha subunit C-terminal domain-containing protein n=1 Tax=Paenibacillus soyae TaxID=2969249 RepID=A0A9X2SAG7_9BACL|nr:RNA polymerase alpha subunit C-terminal domain-containing protein [Paenibacillus soyae]MCR2806000.1 RNA polymerase alpha subunit C-terminal domain-containing protein [Paenibacillus soyae]